MQEVDVSAPEEDIWHVETDRLSGSPQEVPLAHGALYTTDAGSRTAVHIPRWACRCPAHGCLAAASLEGALGRSGGRNTGTGGAAVFMDATFLILSRKGCG